MKPLRCAWCERPIEQPHDRRVVNGVDYHACAERREQVVGRERDRLDAC